MLVVLCGLVVAVLLWAPLRSDPASKTTDRGFTAPGPAGRAVLWAVGDGADGSVAAKAVAARIRSEHVDRFLYLGDVYGPESNGAPDDSADDFRRRYSTVYGGLTDRTAPTPGNHEWPRHAIGYDPYWKRVTGRDMPAYYSFRAGGWKIISLNSEARHDSGSPQVRWLRARLRGPGTCRLAFWHRPRFSAGTVHGDADDLAPFWNALAGHAALVVAGHEHDMQRFRPIRGITQYVSGAGGHGLYPLERDERLAFGDDEETGALRIELRRGRSDLAFVAADGRVLDSSTVRCQPES